MDDFHENLADEPTTAVESQFSLQELFLVTTFAALLFTGFQWLPPALFATLLGVAACAGLFLLWLYQIDRSSIRIAWWILMATYLVAAMFAVRRVKESGAGPVPPTNQPAPTPNPVPRPGPVNAPFKGLPRRL